MPKTAREVISEHTRMKTERNERFEKLLEAALLAGARAAGEKPCAVPLHRGTVRVRIADGRDPFAVFVRARHGDSWRHGTRALGTHLPAPFASRDQGEAWAQEVCRVLSEGGVHVRLEFQDLFDAGGIAWRQVNSRFNASA